MSAPSPFGKGGRVGFIGLGVMGSGMAHCLLRKGYPLHVYARRAEAAADKKAGKGLKEAKSEDEKAKPDGEKAGYDETATVKTTTRLNFAPSICTP